VVKRRRPAVDEPPSPPPTVARPPCRCSLDLRPLAEVGARLDVGESTLKRWHRHHGMPLVRVTPGGVRATAPPSNHDRG